MLCLDYSIGAVFSRIIKSDCNTVTSSKREVYICGKTI